MTDREIETLYWGTAQLFSPMANHAAVIVKFARMIEQAAIKQEREACEAQVQKLEEAVDRMERNRDMWKGQCERQAQQLEGFRARSEDREGS